METSKFMDITIDGVLHKDVEVFVKFDVYFGSTPTPTSECPDDDGLEINRVYIVTDSGEVDVEKHLTADQMDLIKEECWEKASNERSSGSEDYPEFEPDYI